MMSRTGSSDADTNGAEAQQIGGKSAPDDGCVDDRVEVAKPLQRQPSAPLIRRKSSIKSAIQRMDRQLEKQMDMDFTEGGKGDAADCVGLDDPAGRLGHV